MKFFAFFLFGLITLTSVFCSACDLPFVNVGDKQLYFHNVAMNWFQAFQFCTSNQLQLLTINTSLENYYLDEYLKSNNITIRLWTSGTDLAKEGEWMWMSTAQPFSFNGFYAPQPDNHNGGTVCGTQDCLMIFLSGHCIYWDDYRCSATNQFICEKKI